MASAVRTAEHARLDGAREGKAGWRRRRPYLSERQRGTVREHGADVAGAAAGRGGGA